MLEGPVGALKHSDCDYGPAADLRALVVGQKIAVHLQKCQPAFLGLRSVGPDLRHHHLLKLDHRIQMVADPPD